MQSINIICVGKLKEKYLIAAVDEYSKRLQRYCRFNITELKDEPTPDNPSERERAIVLEKEGKRILEKIPPSAHVTALCIEGRQSTSEAFAESFSSSALSGISQKVFIIGGSMGLSDEVKKRADAALSFSPMTFPHQLMRVMLCEQIYRAHTIINGEKYHK